jgi:hypothetical protein
VLLCSDRGLDHYIKIPLTSRTRCIAKVVTDATGPQGLDFNIADSPRPPVPCSPTVTIAVGHSSCKSKRLCRFLHFRSSNLPQHPQGVSTQSPSPATPAKSNKALPSRFPTSSVTASPSPCHVIERCTALAIHLTSTVTTSSRNRTTSPQIRCDTDQYYYLSVGPDTCTGS